jgi:hypothetical protein
MTDRELMQQALDAFDSDNPDIQLRTAVALRNRMSQLEPLNFTPDVTPLLIDCPRCGHCCPQPNQEPVAWRTFDGEGGYDYRNYEDNEEYAKEWEQRNPKYKGWVEPLYIAPQPCPTCESLARTVMMDQTSHDTKRPWIDLTDDEIKSLPSWWPSYEDAPALIKLVKDVEAKLKEKNGG